MCYSLAQCLVSKIHKQQHNYNSICMVNLVFILSFRNPIKIVCNYKYKFVCLNSVPCIMDIMPMDRLINELQNRLVNILYQKWYNMRKAIADLNKVSFLMNLFYYFVYIYIYIKLCVCVCLSVCSTLQNLFFNVF